MSGAGAPSLRSDAQANRTVPVALSDRRRKITRALLAIPSALVVGLVALGLGVPKLAASAKNGVLFVMIATMVGVLVPPRTIWWAVGVVAGGLVAAVFGEAALLGIPVAVVAFVAIAAVDSWSYYSRGKPERGPT